MMQTAYEQEQMARRWNDLHTQAPDDPVMPEEWAHEMTTSALLRMLDEPRELPIETIALSSLLDTVEALEPLLCRGPANDTQLHAEVRKFVEWIRLCAIDAHTELGTPEPEGM